MKTERKYGWLVVFATFLVGFVTDGIAFSFGILLTELLHAFKQGRASTVIIGSIATGVMHLIGKCQTLKINIVLEPVKGCFIRRVDQDQTAVIVVVDLPFPSFSLTFSSKITFE